MRCHLIVLMFISIFVNIKAFAILGGDEVNSSNQPELEAQVGWVLEVDTQGNPQSACTSVLIAQDVVLTAAHCLPQNPQHQLMVLFNANPSEVLKPFALNKQWRLNIPAIRAQVPESYGVKRILSNPHHLPDTTKVTHAEYFKFIAKQTSLDMALLLLDHKAPIENVVGFADASEVDTSSKAVLTNAGFGLYDILTESKTWSSILPGLRLRTAFAEGWDSAAPFKQSLADYVSIGDKDLSEMFRVYSAGLSPRAHFFARRSTTSDGDSGGPLFQSIDNKLKLVGLVSSAQFVPGDDFTVLMDLYVNLTSAQSQDWIQKGVAELHAE